MNRLKEKELGGIQVVLFSMFLLFFLILILSLLFTSYALSNYAMDMKNECDMSNLSTYKYISQQDLSQSGEAVIESADVNNVYQCFKQYLEKNMGLDSNLTPLNKNGYITQPLTINTMIIYSFKNGLLNEYEYTAGTGSFTTVYSGYSGTVTAPTGQKVSHTSIYTEVQFTLNLFNMGYTYTNSIKSYTGITTSS